MKNKVLTNEEVIAEAYHLLARVKRHAESCYCCKEALEENKDAAL